MKYANIETLYTKGICASILDVSLREINGYLASGELNGFSIHLKKDVFISKESLERLIVKFGFDTNTESHNRPNCVEDFFKDCMVFEVCEGEKTEDIYTAFVDWCNRKNIPSLTKNVFFKGLVKVSPLSIRVRESGGTPRRYRYINLRLKSNSVATPA